MSRAGFIALGLATLALPIAVVAGTPQDDMLKPASAFAGIGDQKKRSVALFLEMGKVIQSPRCLNCHPRSDRPNQTDAMTPHEPMVTRGVAGFGAPGMQCMTCHGPTNVSFASGKGSIPGNPKWHLAPLKMAWEGKSLGDICRQIKDPALNDGKSLADLVKHNGEDTLVGWGWHPGKDRKPAPGTQAEFGALTQAWVDSGAACPK